MATEKIYCTAADTLTLTNLTGTYEDINEDPTTPDGNVLPASSNAVSVIAHTTFQGASGVLTEGADLQTFKAFVVQFDEGQTGEPTARIELWHSGVLVRAGTNTAVPNGGVLLTLTWNATEATTDAGVECNVVGTKLGGGGGARNAVRVDAIEWTAAYDEGGVTVPLTGAVSSTSTTAGAVDNQPGLASTVTSAATLAGVITEIYTRASLSIELIAPPEVGEEDLAGTITATSVMAAVLDDQPCL
jgi:hypothetical protein